MSVHRHRLRPVAFVLLFALLTLAQGDITAAAQSPGQDGWLEAYHQPASRLIGAALADRAAWQRLAELTDTVGNRLSGSERLNRAIAWAITKMKEDGLENVHTEPVMVPHWVRGHEDAEIVEPAPHRIAMLGLGGSVATPEAGLQAEAIVVRNFGELDARAKDVRGKIVVFNEPYEGYGRTVVYRVDGASRAARYGALGVLVRSVGLPGLRTPHTGYMEYAADAPKIPAAAIASEDADRLQRMQDRGDRIVVRLKMESHFLPDAPSANVVGEIRGSERPDEVVVVSGHLDSWDVGDGATDDGGGCIVTWEALRLMKQLGLRPRRTVRVVLWTNEENGTRGGLAYRELHKAELSNTVLMLESDSGVFTPLGVGFTGSDRSRQIVGEIATLLRGIGAATVGARGGGADIEPSADAAGIPTMSLDVDESKYFLIHHSEADTIDKIDPNDVARCVATVAVMAYVVADMPGRLER